MWHSLSVLRISLLLAEFPHLFAFSEADVVDIKNELEAIWITMTPIVRGLNECRHWVTRKLFRQFVICVIFLTYFLVYNN